MTNMISAPRTVALTLLLVLAFSGIALGDTSYDGYDVDPKSVAPQALKRAIGWLSRDIAFKYKSPDETQLFEYEAFERNGNKFIGSGKGLWCSTKWLSSEGYHYEDPQGCNPARYPVLKRQSGYILVALDVLEPQLVWLKENASGLAVVTVLDQHFTLRCLDAYSLLNMDSRIFFERPDMKAKRSILRKSDHPFLAIRRVKGGFAQVAPYVFTELPENFDEHGKRKQLSPPPPPLGWIRIWDESGRLTLWNLCPYDSSC